MCTWKRSARARVLSFHSHLSRHVQTVRKQALLHSRVRACKPHRACAHKVRIILGKRHHAHAAALRNAGAQSTERNVARRCNSRDVTWSGTAVKADITGTLF